jgi:rod shape-determining protein MreD
MTQFTTTAINIRIFISILVALLFTTIPLPGFIADIRPLFVPLVVLYWAIFFPLQFGLGKAFLSGLILEAMQSLVIGQAVMCLIAITYFALKNSRRIQLASLPQQMLTVAMILLVYQFLQIWMESVLGRPADYSARFIVVITSMILWPGIIVFMRSLILKQRVKTD